MTAVDDAALVKQLQDPSTQREAFAVLVNQYSRPLYYHIRKMVLSHDDADDLLQNTFLKAWSNLELFRGDARLATWLYRIAINECLTFLDKQRKRQQVSLDGEESVLIQKLITDEWFDGDELQLELQKAIASLPDKQRIVFNMKYYDEMKYEDISQILGTSVGALKASYHHAVKKIEEYFSSIELNLS